MKLKKRRMDLVLPEHHEVFKRLLEDPVIKRFLAWDKNLRVSDKYLLSMVIAYFSRAGLFSWQYQRIHFFLALYLASDMEEDNQAPKQDIFYFLYGKSYALRPLFHKLRYQFICSMGWNTRVSMEECEEYLLSMVIAYFSRAGLFSWQYQRIHFFLALYLANDMEEDNQAPKQDIFYFLYGQSYALRPLFHKLRYQFICSMGWNTWVSLEECEEVGGAVCLVEGEGGADWRLREVGGCRWDVGRRKPWRLHGGKDFRGSLQVWVFWCFSVSEPNVYLKVLYAI
ncbi:Speedy protein E4 [Sciurus carolinensis]|uniref:Speedy protein E4 n=1 Tax=Sciurus carolinensis TaxID=30640 RepID=A0AA41T294_SCICA|nr:Speedy protein E4 [Sciurus carolinensis]